MANKGKRMVNEDLIKQIGQGGGGTTYTAGDGISISAEDVISVDNTVALKSDLATVATTGAYSDLTGTPTIPASVSGTSNEFYWTTITIGDTTKDIPQPGGGGSSDCPIVTWLDPDKVVTGLPSSTSDQSEWTAWFKTLPVIIGRNNGTYGKSQLVSLGFPEDNIFITEQGTMLQIRGCFLRTQEANSNTNTVSKLVLMYNGNFVSSSRPTKDSVAVQTIHHINNTRFVIDGVIYRGLNTWASSNSIVDPLGNPVTMVCIDQSSNRCIEIDVKSGDTFVYNSFVPMGIASPNGTSAGEANSVIINGTTLGAGTYALQATVDSNNIVTGFNWTKAIPECPSTTDGTYVLKATVASGVVTYTWVAEV